MLLNTLLMKLHFLLLVFICLLSHFNAISQTWQLVWQDEFTNGIGPDWVFETGNGGNGWGNKELQYYQSKNATVENGELIITARIDSVGGFNYTSTRMKTQGRKSWKYGKVEARIAMPRFQGIWPAFWMLGDNISSVGWPACGEIDIMEHINTENLNHGTIHWKKNSQHASNGDTTSTNVTDYHVYAIEWTPATIKWLVDGVPFHEANIANGVNDTEEFHNNFFILLNMAVGGNWPGFSIDKTAFPAKMKVDYVRVYQQKN
ncbi:glycosyl hydrolase family 16 [Niastella koreensis]|uniref:Glucan endo-1,3-beta-D-glucosidase n=3 Tax=Niastella koreensis TaxID=354356 RepID=G8TRL1_NIAKG|nr:Glucan endo-1,3-beta-D-glucosidase [Niastella koreensis GR20-10]OQP45913.1 glycosyl hydrolase family 16 [Niastella koreensis]